MSPFARATRAHNSIALTRTTILAGAACTGLTLLAACSAGANGSGGSAAGIPSSEHRAMAAAPRTAANPGKEYNAQHSGQARLVLSPQSIIYTADLTLRVKDVTVAATTATDLVTAAGGYISSEQDTVPHDGFGTPRVIVQLKIPVAQYKQVLGQLSSDKLGRTLFFNQHAQNVTQQVADVSSRVASAQAGIRQLRALLSRAGSVSALLSVQVEINNQESALESLLAQQQALAHATSYGTVTLTLLGHHVAFVKKPKKTAHGFVAGLKSGWHALVTVVDWVLTALGAMLPFLVPIAVLLGIAFELRRWLRRRRVPAAEPPATAES